MERARFAEGALDSSAGRPDARGWTTTIKTDPRHSRESVSKSCRDDFRAAAGTCWSRRRCEKSASETYARKMSSDREAWSERFAPFSHCLMTAFGDRFVSLRLVLSTGSMAVDVVVGARWSTVIRSPD